MKCHKVLLLLFSSFFMILACKKEGCTNPTAKNYNPEAKKDDGSCVIESVIENNQPKNDHTYTMISSSGDTLLYGVVPYQDGLAQTGDDEDNNRYRLKTLLVSNDDPGLISGSEIYLNQNNEPEMSSINGENNDGNAFSFQTLGIDGLMYAFYEGTITIENFEKHELLNTGTAHRTTATIIYDGIFVDMADEQISAKFSITFSN